MLYDQRGASAFPEKSMPGTNIAYNLKVLGTEVRAEEGGQRLVVGYEGRYGSAEISRPLASLDLDGLLAGCEAVAQAIFHQEFRLNNQVDLHFALQDRNGLKIWHTQPTLYMKCPLTMSMKWSCLHLSQTYKTMTTLGVVELPSELSLVGNAVGVNETVRVIMDSMASGLEFMGNIMLMRNTIDHDAEAGRALASGGAQGKTA
jgi:hypothetical protein